MSPAAESPLTTYLQRLLPDQEVFQIMLQVEQTSYLNSAFRRRGCYATNLANVAWGEDGTSPFGVIVPSII